MALVVATVIWISWRPTTDKEGSFRALFAFSMLGLVTGVLAGFSRQPVVGAVLPAVLSLVGGLAIYLIGNPNNRILVSLCVLVLAFNLFVGATWGAVLREAAEEYKHGAQYLMNRALAEVEVREFRESLGLPKDLDKQK